MCSPLICRIFCATFVWSYYEPLSQPTTDLRLFDCWTHICAYVPHYKILEFL